DRGERTGEGRRLVAWIGEGYTGCNVRGRSVCVPPRPDAPLHSVGVPSGAAGSDRTLNLDGPWVGIDRRKPLGRGDIRLRRDLVLRYGANHAVSVDAAVAEEGIPSLARRIALRRHWEAGTSGVVNWSNEVKVICRCGDELVDFFRGNTAAGRHATGAIQRSVVRDRS